jgi:hypothetical protein
VARLLPTSKVLVHKAKPLEWLTNSRRTNSDSPLVRSERQHEREVPDMADVRILRRPLEAGRVPPLDPRHVQEHTVGSVRGRAGRVGHVRLNPTGEGTVGTRALVALKGPGSAAHVVKAYNITASTPIAFPATDLAVDAGGSGGKMFLRYQVLVHS